MVRQNRPESLNLHENQIKNREAETDSRTMLLF